MSLFLRILMVLSALLVIGFGLLRDALPFLVTNPVWHGTHIVAGVVLLITVLIWAWPTLFKSHREPSKAEVRATTPSDKERLDFLEQAMRERMVSLSGCMTVPMAIPIGTTDEENEYPFAHVHFNGIGQMGRGSSFRKAIDEAMLRHNNSNIQLPL